MSEEVIIVAKGPSSEGAQSLIDKIGCHVCTVNDSAMLLDSDSPVDFCVFCHADFAERAKDRWGSIRLFMCPFFDFDVNRLAYSVRCQLPSEFPHEKCIYVNERFCPANEDVLRLKIRCGQVVWHHTTVAAMTWMSAMDMKKIHVIGVDGGRDYAKGMHGNHSIDLDEWKSVAHTVGSIISEERGVEIQWHSR